MIDIKDLERRWIRYKIKTYLPKKSLLISAFVLLLGIGSWFLFSDSEKTTQPATPPKPIAASKKPSSVPKSDHEETILEPSMEFIQTYNIPATQELEYQEQQPQKIVQHTPSLGAKPKIIQPKQPIASLPVPVVAAPQALPAPEIIEKIPIRENTSSLSINRNENKLDIDELQRRFKETSNPNLGLFITRYHYDHGNYSEAYNYALKTNSVNSKIDENWILFSKSLVKLGRTEQAKKTLELYQSQSGSENAKSLLSSIENGSFK